ncbi:MAG: SusC/RagA family TonB-linked outer membrane protein [Chitinophagaceae bacterium]|nr:MAG: SusC/RagA family TonB-linked outer membrane protein [Chitinophagaceae bacterium]
MKKLILFIIGMVCAMLSVQAQQTTLHTISGMVLSAKEGTPLVGAIVKVKNKAIGTVTNTEGKFNLQVITLPDTLIVSRIGFHQEQTVIKNSAENPIIIRLEPSNTQLQEVTVSTGYQQIPKERATGSFDFIDNKLLNRSVSPDILGRLKGISSSLLFDSHIGNNLGFSIRGLSTIFANSQPLIILNNFEYDGDINDINPNDVESITILKDAAASSIWGAKSGNGVIVITTKTGKYNSAPRVSFNSNVTITGKPNLFYIPTMSSSDYIGVEEYLFNQGYYDGTLTDPNFPPVSPVVEILNNQRNGSTSASEATAQINALKSHDVRSDYLKYFYQTSVNQQYAINLSGGGANQRYYVSAGYDNDLNNLVGNQYKRTSVNANNTYSLINHKLDIMTGILFTQTYTKNNGLNPLQITSGGGSLYPYAQLANSKGDALPIAQYNQDYLDTVGEGQLLDWNYRPLDEIRLADNNTTGTDYQVNLGITYKLTPYLSVTGKYQYGRGQTDHQIYHSEQTYYTRNLINLFTEFTPNGTVYPVPLGGILDMNSSSYTSQNGRLQLNYNKTWKGKNQLSAIAGTEIKNLNTNQNSYRLYGYDNRYATSTPVDFANFYPTFINGSQQLIPNTQGIGSLTDRYVSYYMNASYNYDNRYTVSVSGRRDASNLFGVKTNQKWVPLWSSGLSWNISNEQFYHLEWLPFLKARVTYGYNGNIDNSVAALLTAQIQGYNNFGQLQSFVINPPNPELRWERTSAFNAGLDFATVKDRISGTIEYFRKRGIDLIGSASLPPSTGLLSFMGNTADMKGNGLDLTVNTENIDRIFKWNTTFLFSIAKNKITDYKAQLPSISSYILPSYGFNPKVGGPVNALYSYKWAGLDDAGNPQGYLNGKLSEDYASIINSSDVSNMGYNGSSVPVMFGSLRNTFSWKQLSFSFIITYKWGYYFRRPSINYYNLFTGSNPGSRDFDKRWQKPGDEKLTDVPAMIYPADPNRDQFYLYSSTTIENGDNIRLQDVQLSYNVNRGQFKRFPFKNIEVYVYASNLGLLWKANKAGLDPDYASSLYSYPPAKSLSAGIKIDF